MKRLTVTQCLHGVTWLGIGFFVLSQVLPPQPFGAITRDSGGTISFDDVAGGRNPGAITLEMVENSPTWHSTAGNPPLSAHAALGIAERLRTDELRETLSELSLRSLSLVPVDAKAGKWCWRIDFEQAHVIGRPRFFRAYVLMDGRVVIPDA